MDLALWIVAVALAVAFLASSAIKLGVPKEKLDAAAGGGGWTNDVSGGFVKALGVLELLAAVGLILPAVTAIAPVLVPLTAIGLALFMICAMVVHLRRNEAKYILVNLFYLALAAFVAWGRIAPEPFPT